MPRDFPWLHARLEERPGFAAVRPLFDEERRLMSDDGESPDWTGRTRPSGPAEPAV